MYFTPTVARVTLRLMTPFMESVRAVAGGARPPRAAAARRGGAGRPDPTTTHVLVRATAEQLVSEANAVLDDAGGDGHIDLVDECQPGALAFTLVYGHRAARVRTVVPGAPTFGPGGGAGAAGAGRDGGDAWAARSASTAGAAGAAAGGPDVTEVADATPGVCAGAARCVTTEDDVRALVLGLVASHRSAGDGTTH